MKKAFRRLFSTILIFSFLGQMLCNAEENVIKEKPNYLIKSVYNKAENTILVEICVAKSTAIVGQFGLYYDTDLFSLCDCDGKIVDYEIPEKVADTQTSYLTKIVNAEKEVVVFPETNSATDLVSPQYGTVYFAWYVKGQNPIDASQENKKIATISLKLKDSVKIENIKHSSIALAEKPIGGKIVGWTAGALIMNYMGDQFVSNDRNYQKRLIIEKEYVGFNPQKKESTIVFKIDGNEKLPIVEAEIIFVDSNKKIATNEFGYAEIILPDGVYPISVQKEGFNLYEGEIIVSGKDFIRNIELSKKIIYNVQILNLTAKATNSSINLTWVAKGDIESVKNYKVFFNGQSLETEKNEITLKNLNSSTNYEIDVVANSATEEIGKSEKITIITEKSETNFVPSKIFYIVTFEVENGKFLNQDDNYKTYELGTNLKTFPTVLVNDGYKFMGWSREKDGKLLTEINVNGNYTLYAVLEKISEKPIGNIDNTENIFNHKPYILGYEDGTFRPQKSITRAEAAVIISRISQNFDENQSYSCDFSDVTKDKWYYNYIAFCETDNLYNGYDDKTFKPDNEITRGEFAALIARFLKLNQDNENIFSDIDENYFAIGYINSLYKLNIIGGYEDKRFRPHNKITRAETIKIVNHALNRTHQEKYFEDFLKENKMPFFDIETHWAKFEIIEATSEH